MFDPVLQYWSLINDRQKLQLIYFLVIDVAIRIVVVVIWLVWAPVGYTATCSIGIGAIHELPRTMSPKRSCSSMSDVVIIVHVVRAAEAETSKRVAKNSWPEAVVVMVPRVMVFGVPHSLAHHLRIRNAEDHQLFVISVGHHTVHTCRMQQRKWSGTHITLNSWAHTPKAQIFSLIFNMITIDSSSVSCQEFSSEDHSTIAAWLPERFSSFKWDAWFVFQAAHITMGWSWAACTWLQQ